MPFLWFPCCKIILIHRGERGDDISYSPLNLILFDLASPKICLQNTPLYPPASDKLHYRNSLEEWNLTPTVSRWTRRAQRIFSAYAEDLLTLTRGEAVSLAGNRTYCGGNHSQKGVNALRRRTWKVGELAELMGISVRTLHYYEEMGLLSPSRTTKGGHRLYTADEVTQVQQVMWLRHMGLGLREVKEYLASAAFSKGSLLHLYGSWLRERVELGEELCARLEAIKAWLGSDQEVPARELMRTMKVMSMLDKPLDLQQRQTSNTGGPGIEPEHDW